MIESEIKQKDSAIGGTQNNVKTLEMNHVAGLTDLRGRVARCDAAISRFACFSVLMREQLRIRCSVVSDSLPT